MEDSKERKFRINLKQNAKGDWYGEFTVKSDDLEEVKTKVQELKAYVEETCKKKSEIRIKEN